MLIRKIYFVVIMIFISAGLLTSAENNVLRISVKEKQGLARDLEYIEINCQLPPYLAGTAESVFIAQDPETVKEIPCQTYLQKTSGGDDRVLVQIIFPVSVKANQEKVFHIIRIEKLPAVASDLKLTGQGTELIVDNEFYQANLTKSDAAEPQSHKSGQIRELLIKMGFNQLLTNAEDRLHWAPNFKRPELEWYTTIAHWESPKMNEIHSGPYEIRTVRQDLAPDHPEIMLTAVYRFYAGLPWFRFFSRMEMKDNVWLELLRNDEMSMDSMFTHVAFERPGGEIVDVAFPDRYELLKKQPIENECPWICFYNIDKGFAFGSIRVHYDNTNLFGDVSPTWQPHTQIGEWLHGIKYWNRRLIHDHLTFVQKGSCYSEENAYLVFRIQQKGNRLQEIRDWAERIRHPLQVNIEYP
jgi:hypothetical protein